MSTYCGTLIVLVCMYSNKICLHMWWLLLHSYCVSVRTLRSFLQYSDCISIDVLYSFLGVTLQSAFSFLTFPLLSTKLVFVIFQNYSPQHHIIVERTQHIFPCQCWRFSHVSQVERHQRKRKGVRKHHTVGFVCFWLAEKRTCSVYSNN